VGIAPFRSRRHDFKEELETTEVIRVNGGKSEVRLRSFLLPAKNAKEYNMKKRAAFATIKILEMDRGNDALPGIVMITIFIIVPFFMNVGYAFTDYNTASDVPNFIGFANFKTMFNDRDFGGLHNTLKLI
jgi:hypothetical protein